MATKSPTPATTPSRRRPRVQDARAQPRRRGGRGAAGAPPLWHDAFDPDGVARAWHEIPDEESLQVAADRLQGLAHPSRLKALIALATSELCVGDVATLLGLSLSATSTMLKQLRTLGYLTTQSAGKQTYYRLASDRVPRMIGLAMVDDDE